ncbi:Uncharacterised protein [Mycobacteroides abscessus]|nr:Uncharacterised protein [Mycobacteroides abscessus]
MHATATLSASSPRVPFRPGWREPQATRFERFTRLPREPAHLLA